jgi:hypothetical protein
MSLRHYQISSNLGRSLLCVALAAAPMLVSCGDLPSTAPPLPKARGGDSGSGGAPASAGTNSKGGSSSGKSGSSGSGSGGPARVPRRIPARAAAAGNPGNGGSGAEGGEVDPGGGGDDAGGASSSAGGRAGSANGGKGGSAGALGGAGSGGSSNNAGSAGSQPTGEFFGDSRCTSEFELCEDFESGDIDGDVWDTSSNVPEVDDTRAARGDYALHLHTEGPAFSYISTSEPFPASNNTYYGRMFVWFDTLPTAPEWAHWSISVGEGDGDGSEVRLGGQLFSNDDEGLNFFGVGSDHGATGDWTNLDRDDAPEGVPEKEWICVEWLNDGDGNEGRVWINEVERPSLHTTATEHGGDGDYILPTFETVWFGWWHYQSGTTPAEFDTWIDEIVIDDERIGCTN